METKENEKEVVRKQTYFVRLTTLEDGSTELFRECDGFNAYELLGVLDLTAKDIVQQIKGVIKPDVVKRNVITD